MRPLPALLALLLTATVAHAGPYVVKSGDSLSVIAHRFKSSVAAIKQANGLTSNKILVGQVLDVPGPAVEPEPTLEERVYVVKSGDSLSRIGDRFGVPWRKIRDRNGISGTLITPGLRLTIPGIPTDDGLSLDIALPSSQQTTTFAASADAQVAVTVTASSQTATSTAVSTAKAVPLFHIVRGGNTLGKIAIQYQTTVQEIQALNGLTSDVIQIGQHLKIPGLLPIDPQQFYIQHIAMTVSTAELTKIARVIKSEVPASAPYEGAVAVGAVILNRVRSSKFPNTIDGVVTVSQFNGYGTVHYNGAIPDYAWRAAREALSGVDPVSGADHYYNPFLVAPKWAKRFSFVRRIGTTAETAHDFYHSDNSGFAEFLASIWGH